MQELVVIVAFGQGIATLIKYMKDPHNYGTATPLIPQIEAIQKSYVFYPLVSILILITGFFLAPVGILLYVQSMNFILGRTTMERFSRSAGDQD